jgi:hypothetical protein
LQVTFLGEGKLFEQSFPSPADLRSNSAHPLSFQKRFKNREKDSKNQMYRTISLLQTPFLKDF